MIKTHRPRGYQWNCPSPFQQTPLFRDIVYPDSPAIHAEPLCSDSDDDFPPSKRAAKRRRVEKLADDFLNGHALQIHSARLDPQTFLKTIFWSSERPVTGLYRGGEDVEDRGRFTDRTHDTGQILAESVEVEIQQSSCQRRRSRKIVGVALGPSDAALRKAAELRNRRLRTAASQVIEESQPYSCPRKILGETQQSLGSTEQESFSDHGPSPTPAWTSAKWRETGLFKPRPPRKPVDQDCSKDELGISSFAINTQPMRPPIPGQRHSSQLTPYIEQSEPLSFVADDPATSHGIDDANASQLAERLSSAISAVESQADDSSPGKVPDTIPKGRVAKSIGNAPSTTKATRKRDSKRRQSAPSESQKVEPCGLARSKRKQYDQSVGANTSPFVFRKRSSRSTSGEEPEKDDPGEIEKAPSPQVILPRSASRPTMPACPAQDPRTPLLNEHLNRILPKTGGTGRTSSSLRASLLEEMKACNAELSMAPSSPPGGRENPMRESIPAQNNDDENDPPVIPVPESQVLWPGTQALLAKAQHDLFTSPDKSDTALYLGDRSTPHPRNGTAKRARPPLQTLSQEQMPMPSTQALLDDWGGWSSIKKPRPLGNRPSINDSPSLHKADARISASDPSRRRSSLRHSSTIHQDPSPKPHSQPVQSTTQTIPFGITKSSDTHSSFPKPSGKIASSLSFSALSVASAPEQPPTGPTPCDPTSRPVSLSFGASETALPIPAPPAPPANIDDTTTLGDISFGPPLGLLRAEDDTNVMDDDDDGTSLDETSFGATGGLDAPTPSYLKQNAQAFAMGEMDSQDLQATVHELATDVLGAATMTFSF